MKKFSVEEIAQAMSTNKWHLLEIENVINSTGYGSVIFKLEVRAGKVEKITFRQHKTILSPKA